MGALSANITGSANTATGVNALVYNFTGYNNTAIGGGALYTNGIGNNNTAMGSSALKLRTGHYNTAIGQGAGFYAETGDDNIYINNYGSAADSGVIRIETQGIESHTQIAGIRGTTTNMADGVAVVIDSTGQLGTVSSSRRFKEGIADMGQASDRLMGLRPVTFRYTKAYADGGQPIQYGLIAEEVAEVYPELVADNAAGEVETVQYYKLNGMLLNEVQKQHRKIENQQETIEGLMARLSRLEAARSDAGELAAVR